MLVLHRKLNEKVEIGDNIEVIVTDIGHGYVRLGITAPIEIPIRRPEAKSKEPKNREIRAPEDGGRF